MNLEDLLNHPNPEIKAIWEKSSQKEYGNLFQGSGDTVGMDVCEFIKKSDVPMGKKVTYPRTVVAYRNRWKYYLGKCCVWENLFL